MKKKTGIIVSVLLLALSLTACGNSASSATTSFSVNSKMAKVLFEIFLQELGEFGIIR